MISLCDGETDSVDQQAKCPQGQEERSSSTQMDAQSNCFAVELFLLVSVDLHTPNTE